MHHLTVSVIFCIYLQHVAAQGGRVPVVSNGPPVNSANLTVSTAPPRPVSSGERTPANITLTSSASLQPSSVPPSTPPQGNSTSALLNSTQTTPTPFINVTQQFIVRKRTTVTATTSPSPQPPVKNLTVTATTVSNTPIPRIGFNRNNGRMEGRVFPLKNDSGSPPPQTPGVWEALTSLILNGHGQTLKSDEQAMILWYAVPGVDYPSYTEIPDTSFSCDTVNQAGFYADPEASCQVFRRCDLDGNLWSFLCPNQTLFNQITLICDWFFNVDCAKSKSFYDYSNSRLYHEMWRLLDDPTVSQK